MAKIPPQPEHHRPTLGEQLARQHELLMAQATKPARTGSQTVEYGERATGADSGSHYLKSLVLVQHDDETDLQFLGRQEQRLLEVHSLLERVNSSNGADPDADEDGDDD